MPMLRPALSLVAGFTLLLGLAVPLAVTGVAGALMPGRAGGSLLRHDGRVVGSALIGQQLADPRWFHTRPVADAQLGPTSKALLEAMQKRIAAEGGAAPVPADAVSASASGLDPDISPENANRQVARVAAARGLDPARVAAVVSAHTQGPALGLLGAPRVNVLRLNLALDALH